MYFDEPESNVPISPHGDVELLISANGLAVLVFGIFPQTLMTLCVYAIR
jgi:NADH-quinone oxidoreductase subunit N